MTDDAMRATRVRRKRLLARSQARGVAGRSLASDPITSSCVSILCGAETHDDVRRLAETDLEAAFRLRLEALSLERDAFCTTLEEAVESGPVFLQESLQDTARAAVLGAFVLGADDTEDALVGMVAVYRERAAKLRHRAAIVGMYVDKTYRGIGLGGHLIDAAVSFARDELAVRQVHLGVEADHAPAIGLYESRGFVAWGREPASGMDGGRLLDQIHMLKVF
jgi:ribosomal protein S18 acetylase RimI-like enzyme